MLKRLLAVSLIAAMPVTVMTVVVPADAQQSATISTIRIEGNQRIEPATIESYLSLGRGDRFDPVALDDSLKNLFATGLFEDVQLRQEGDTLVVQVVENPIINRIAFEGNQRIDAEVLEGEVQLRPRVVYTRSRVQNAVARIVEVYRRQGRFAATVEPQIIRLPENRVDVVFEINEGPLTGVERVIFLGNENFSDAQLRGVIETQESAWWRFLSSADSYDPDRLAFDQELLRQFYRANGYAEFQVRSALAELTPDGSAFFITFTVDEGPLYSFGEIDVDTTIRNLDPEVLREDITTEQGTLFNADQIEDTAVAMTEDLGSLGYAFVEIDPQLSVDREQNTIGINYVVNEGPRVYIERIDITGNVRTLDEVIRREFRLSEGDAFNTTLLRRSEQRIRNLGYFETVTVRQVPGSAPDRVVIQVEVAERSTGELSFGVGFSTQDGPLGDIRLTERNLLGTGQEIEARVTGSGRRQEAEFSYTDPWFLGYEFAAGFDIFRSRTDFQSESSFDERRTGARIRGGYPLTEFLQHSLRFTVERDEVLNVDEDASEFIQDEENDVTSFVLGQSFTYDRRDTVFLPTRGYILRLDQDAGIPGTENQYLRHNLSASWYYPFTPDWVLNLAAQGGVIFGYGGEDVRLADRFFVGGSNLRGFSYAGIGPRDEDTDDALGGNRYFTTTAELRFPLGLPDELNLYGRVFTDAGSLWDVDLSGPNLVDNDDLRASAGVGLSWLSPLGPISIDLAQAILKQSEDETELFRLSFGTRF